MGIITENDYHRIALILVEALYYGDLKAARNNGVSARTLRNYRKRLNEDDALAVIFLKKRDEFELNWSSKLSGAIISGIGFLSDAAKNGDSKDPAMVAAITDAVKTLAEIGLTKDMIDAKIGNLRYGGEEGKTDRPLLTYPYNQSHTGAE